MTSFQDESGFQKYEDFPLVHSMLQYETSRTASLKEQGKPQMTYPQSSDGWIPTIFIIEGRALDWMIFPWLLVVGHATAYTFLQEIFFPDHSRDNDSWEIFFRYPSYLITPKILRNNATENRLSHSSVSLST